jgi:hypothetical protein
MLNDIVGDGKMRGKRALAQFYQPHPKCFQGPFRLEVKVTFTACVAGSAEHAAVGYPRYGGRSIVQTSCKKVMDDSKSAAGSVVIEAVLKPRRATPAKVQAGHVNEIYPAATRTARTVSGIKFVIFECIAIFDGDGL